MKILRRIFGSQLRVNMVTGPATNGVNFIIMAVMYPLYLHYLGYETYGVWLALGAVLTFVRLTGLYLHAPVTLDRC